VRVPANRFYPIIIETRRWLKGGASFWLLMNEPAADCRRRDEIQLEMRMRNNNTDRRREVGIDSLPSEKMPTPELGAILGKIIGEMAAGIVHPQPNRDGRPRLNDVKLDRRLAPDLLVFYFFCCCFFFV